MVGVNSREELLETLQNLGDGGHRQEFDEVRGALSEATPGQMDATKRAATERPSISNKVDVVTRHAKQLGNKGIAAWDFGRYVSLKSATRRTERRSHGRPLRCGGS